MEPYNLEFLPGHLKAQDMCNKAVCIETFSFKKKPISAGYVIRQYGKTLLLCSMSLIGLLQGRVYTCGMMTVNIEMMMMMMMMVKIIFLSGTMFIKNESFKKPQ